MSRIKSKGTKPELLVRKFLFSKGFRFRLNKKELPGKPDIVLSKYRTVIFVNGCYWHGHRNCKYSKLPETNSEFWKQKIDGNIARDRDVCERLIVLGWKVITIWQCQLKADVREKTFAELQKHLETNER